MKILAVLTNSLCCFLAALKDLNMKINRIVEEQKKKMKTMLTAKRRPSVNQAWHFNYIYPVAQLGLVWRVCKGVVAEGHLLGQRASFPIGEGVRGMLPRKFCKLRCLKWQFWPLFNNKQDKSPSVLMDFYIKTWWLYDVSWWKPSSQRNKKNLA